MVVINTIHFIILNNAYNIANNAGYCWLFTWLLLILWLFIIGLLYMAGTSPIDGDFNWTIMIIVMCGKCTPY